MSHQSIDQLFRDVTERYADRVAYRYKRDGEWIDVGWPETRDLVFRVARAMMALGVQKGDRVGILGQTRLEWVLCDFGCQCRGSVTVGVYPSNLAPDAAYVLEHSGSVLVFVENLEQLDKVVAERAKLPQLQHIVIWDGDSEPDRGVLSWEEFLGRADEVSTEQLEGAARSLEPDDLASLVYTSGTTGVPKGAMISHGNLVFTSDSAGQMIALEAHYATLLFLPLAHIFARLIVYVCMRVGVTVAFAEDLTKVAENIKEIRPHFLPSVPRIYEKVYDKIISGAETAGGIKLKLFNWAVKTGFEVAGRKEQGQSVPFFLGLQHGLADRLVFSKIKAALGGRLVFAVSGGAPLNQSIAEFFNACGVLILEGLGMTENTSFTNLNTLEHNRFGTVGRTGPGIEMKLADDGEVLFRGKNVMQGYFRSPEATAETIDADGWLLTGDIGEIEDGFLRITDRKKDLIITAGGKNVAPQRIERILRESRFIAHAMAHGDRRKFLTAVITLDPDHIREWAAGKGLGDTPPEKLADNPEVRSLIEREVESQNGQLASFESIKAFHIAPVDFTVEGGELTPTMKVRRKIVFEKYGQALEQLYE